jgi:hypothetical protein
MAPRPELRQYQDGGLALLLGLALHIRRRWSLAESLSEGHLQCGTSCYHAIEAAGAMSPSLNLRCNELPALALRVSGTLFHP